MKPVNALMVGIGICGGSVAVAESSVTAYGLINKELRYVSQSVEVDADKAAKVTDVDGAETRMGVKGSTPGKGLIKSVDGKLELGVNSAGDNSGAEGRIRVRLANAKLNLKNAGSFTFGKDWTPSSLFYIRMDPFSGTVAQSFNLDQSYLNGGFGYGTFKGVGYSFRPFRNQVKYTSPTMGGVTAHLTYDTGGPHNFSSADETATPKNNTELHVAYNHKMVDLGLTYVKCTGCSEDFPMTDFSLGAKVKLNAITIGVNYNSQEIAYKLKTGSTDEFEAITADRVYFAADYAMGDMGFSLSHAEVSASDDLVGGTEEAPTTIEGATQSISAVGARYSVAKNVMLRLTLATATAKADTTIVTNEDGEAKKENSATIAAFGVKVGI